MVERPERLVFVTGTGTEVGKTWVAARLAEVLRARGLRVVARKPAQSFGPDENRPTDADVLGAATGEAPETVCPRHRWYEVAMAPPMAADALGRAPIKIAELAAEIEFGDGVEIGLVETAGGVRSPLAHDGDTVDLMGVLKPDAAVLVADAGLGTINAVLLSFAALAPVPVPVILNRFDAGNELHVANREWLGEHYGLDVVVDVDAIADRIMPIA
ncbi:MAG TPA: dethiobiotin synthase [Acidimicrobiales bacterium]|nr:dethiobiotin synthase [Acidimicrobiales bacterium]